MTIKKTSAHGKVYECTRYTQFIYPLYARDIYTPNKRYVFLARIEI